MGIPVSFGGATYIIPETGETGWGDETTNYLVAISQALLRTDVKFKTSIISTATATLPGTITIACINYTLGAQTTTIPIGVTDKLYIIQDKSGTAATNNITVQTTGGQLIAGQTSFVIKENYGAIFIVFDGATWNIISEGKSYIRSTMNRLNNVTNTSFVEQSVTRQTAPNSCANGQTATVTLSGSSGMDLMISFNSGENIYISADFASDKISALSDKTNIFLDTDAGVGLYVFKSATSGVISFKNRFGSARNIEIKSLTARIVSATAWA